MTGFGSASRAWPEAPGGAASVSLEVRSVNSRYLEVKVRQPFGVAAEHALRKQIEAALGRGRVDVWVHVHASTEDGASALTSAGIEVGRLDISVRAALEATRRAADAGLELLPPSPMELLRFSGALSSAEGAHEAPPFLAALVDEAVAGLQSMRETEGDALAAVLGEMLAELEDATRRLRDAIADQGEQIRARLQARIEDLCQRVSALEPERDRVAQEVALLVAKADVAEELARIDSHLAQARAVLAESARTGQGKTLDFLSQELLREITTIGGKIQQGSAIVIEAKGIVGRIREQVQNVE
jgi:uncharacterized protein (TIGR00255 family)